MIAGFYQGSANFGATTLTGGSGANIFIAKMNKTTGAFTWAKSAGGDTAGTVFTSSAFPAQYGGSIDTDSSGNIYFSGKVDGTSPSFGAINITLNNGDADMFVAKIDSSGNYIWVKNYGSSTNPQNMHVHGLVVDDSNRIYAASGFAGSMTVGATTLNSLGSIDVSNSAIIKLEDDGTELWAISGGTVGDLVGANDLPYDLALDSNQDLYLAGYYGGSTATFGAFTVTGSPVGSTIITAKISPAGSFTWVRQLITSSTFGTTRDMYIDSSDNIYIGGVYSNTLTDGTFVISGTGANAFFGKYDTSGNLLDLETIGGTGGQLLVAGVGGNQVRAVAEYNGKLYIAGEYFDTVGIGGQTVTSTGDQDGFYTTWVSNQVSVKVDGVEVNANFVSSTELTFVTPLGTSGLKDITITNQNGQAFTLSNGFEYIGNEITNSNITSVVCSPSNTSVNTSVNCVVTTNVNLNTLSGSVNLRIGASGTVVNCPVTGSGTTLNCNNIPVGGTIGTFPAQYNASGSGSTYLNGNNITVGSAPVCTPGASGTGSNGNTAITDILLCLTAGNLVLTSPVSANFTSLTVSDVEQNSAANLTGVTVEDLRGSEAGWSLVCKSTNLTGVTFADTVIPLFSGSVSKFNLTPSALQVVGGYGSTQNGLTDYTTQQNTTSLTNTGSTGESNEFSLASFSSGYGIGKYNKNLLLNLTIPPYIRAQSYVGTLTCSVS